MAKTQHTMTNSKQALILSSSGSQQFWSQTL